METVIPNQVFENLGYDKDNKSDMKALNKRYAKKSHSDIVKAAAKIVKMKNDKKPYWLISYAHGLPVSVCKKIVEGTYFDENGNKKDNAESVNDSMFISKSAIFGMENGDKILDKIMRKEFPYHHVLDTKIKIGKKLNFARAEFEMAHYFAQKKTVITSSEKYRSLDHNSRQKVRYALRDKGVDVLTYKKRTIVDSDVLSTVDVIAEEILHGRQSVRTS